MEAFQMRYMAIHWLNTNQWWAIMVGAYQNPLSGWNEEKTPCILKSGMLAYLRHDEQHEYQ